MAGIKKAFKRGVKIFLSLVLASVSITMLNYFTRPSNRPGNPKPAEFISRDQAIELLSECKVNTMAIFTSNTPAGNKATDHPGLFLLLTDRTRRFLPEPEGGYGIDVKGLTKGCDFTPELFTY